MEKIPLMIVNSETSSDYALGHWPFFYSPMSHVSLLSAFKNKNVVIHLEYNELATDYLRTTTVEVRYQIGKDCQPKPETQSCACLLEVIGSRPQPTAMKIAALVVTIICLKNRCVRVRMCKK